MSDEDDIPPYIDDKDMMPLVVATRQWSREVIARRGEGMDLGVMANCLVDALSVIAYHDGRRDQTLISKLLDVIEEHLDARRVEPIPRNVLDGYADFLDKFWEEKIAMEQKPWIPDKESVADMYPGHPELTVEERENLGRAALGTELAAMLQHFTERWQVPNPRELVAHAMTAILTLTSVELKKQNRLPADRARKAKEFVRHCGEELKRTARDMPDNPEFLDEMARIFEVYMDKITPRGGTKH